MWLYDMGCHVHLYTICILGRSKRRHCKVLTYLFYSMISREGIIGRDMSCYGLSFWVPFTSVKQPCGIELFSYALLVVYSYLGSVSAKIIA